MPRKKQVARIVVNGESVKNYFSVKKGRCDTENIQERQKDIKEKLESSPISHTKVDDTALYCLLLKKYDGITPLDDVFCTFAVQHFDERRLKSHVYYIIKRKAFWVEKEATFIYCCTCNQQRSRLVLAAEATDGKELLTALQGLDDCHHITAAHRIISGYPAVTALGLLTGNKENHHTDHEYSLVEDLSDQIFPLKNKEKVLVTRVAGQYSTVYIDCKNRITCSNCRTKFTCKHVKLLKSSTDPHAVDFLSKASSALKYRYINCAKVYASRPVTFFNKKLQLEGCVCSKPSYTESTGNIIMRQSIQLNEPVLQCSCGVQVPKEPTLQGFMSMKKNLIGYDVFGDYLRMFLSVGLPLSSYFKDLVWRFYEDGHNLLDVMTEDDFRSAWIEYSYQLDISKKDSFTCPTCGPTPDIVLMDGMCLGLPKQYTEWSQYMESSCDSQPLKGSSHSRRIFLQHPASQRDLYRYTTEGLSQTDFQTLMDRLHHHRPSLVPLLTSLESLSGLKAPGDYKPLLQCISKASPVCSYLHVNKELRDVLETVQDGVPLKLMPQQLRLLQERCPVLFVLCQAGKIPVTGTKDLIKDLINTAEYPFGGSPHCLPQVDSTESRGVFPSLPPLVQRGSYAMDSNRARVDCTKLTKSHQRLTPGIFSVFCSHGICYGFEMMDNAESPNVPFTVLRTRFPTAPKVIIYDNACNLLNYCLNRDPAFFRDSMFLVDRMHWVNHTGCSSGFNMDEYSQLQGINSQVTEQRHSLLLQLRPMLSSMKLDNFKHHLILFTWFRNIVCILRNFPNDPNFQEFAFVVKLFMK